MCFVMEDRMIFLTERWKQSQSCFCLKPTILPAVLTACASRALFLTDRFPHQVTRLKMKMLSTRQRYTDSWTWLLTPKLQSLLIKYKHCQAFFYTSTTLSLKLIFESAMAPWYLKLDTPSTDSSSVITGLNGSFSFLLSNTSSFVSKHIGPESFP